jgi:phosphatidate cytidylyltransferase
MSPSGRWADFWTRLASAAILAPLALLALWRGGFAWDALVAVALAGLGWEWARLARLRAPFWLAGGLLLAWAALLLAGWAAALLALAAAMLLAAKYFGNFAAAGLPYAGLGGLALLWLRQQPNGLIDTLFLVAVVWGTDIGAYLVGRVMGGAKLAPKISPGKTWSGAVGGLFIGGACGGLLAWQWQALPAAFALSVCAQAGDLLESAIKRSRGVKDSGNTIPGHGGLFDRLDGFLLAAPLAAVLAFCLELGLPAWR